LAGHFSNHGSASGNDAEQNRHNGEEEKDTWIKPPAVPVTIPSAHKTISITAMVYNINFFRFACWLARPRASQQIIDV
jgi:hypothetical protein